MSRLHRPALAVLAALVVTACSGDDTVTTTQAAMPTTTSTSTTTAAPTTTLPPATTSTLPPSTVAPTTTRPGHGEIPYPDNQGDDYLHIMTEINDFVQWLDENPDPGLVEVFAVPDTPFYDLQVEHMEEMVENGWRDAPGDVTDTISVDVLSETFRGRAALLDVVVKSTASTRIDDSGAVVEEIPERPFYRYTIELLLDPEMGWQIAHARRVEEWTD